MDSTSTLRLGQIVHVLKGREAGQFMIVIDVIDDHFIWLADGDKRKFDQAKKKNVKHLQPTHTVSTVVAESLQTTGKVSNAKLRYALNQYQLAHKE
ncbi:KOW domain-containing RNA-binding protein [Mechercharimyces sp. CAU 1602]|uniref:KOW domain-containing RNA-binding protein n=1 Tax=Mechercharimyces sp. CAU 1602 TaxID=2973933 RepID=UPI002163633F|nr:KOW domain-containing RNA-binding protein [Mechercharimyces sp. CAU 1602]MCS1352578.1 KOW domain-containing RNA-binding protein [Mechercharimyces sp. CAU 1602]